MNRACSTNWGEEECMYRILTGKPEGWRPVGRPRRRWVDNIKMDGCGMDWFHLARDRDQWRDLVNMVMYLQVS
jgi:transposase